VGWGFLSAAIVSGGWWSYEVLGWGGYWAWDPVENVSFMPWLTATAFVHSVQVQERRRMLKAWNLLLITATFCLTLLGTFLTRSGVVSSVHAFGDGPVGPAFLVFLMVAMVASLGLLAVRWDQVRDRADLDHPVSREGGFLAGNVVFLVITFAILLGTLFPLIVEAVSGDRVTVGAPFFDAATLPLWMIVLALMGIGPLLPWRRAPNASVLGNLAWMSGSGAVAATITFVVGMRGAYPLLTVALAAWNLASLVLLVQSAVAPRMAASGRSAVHVLRAYAHENRRRFGSMIVHFGIVVIALGILGSSAYRTDEQIRIDIGESAEFVGFELHLLDRFMDVSDRVISAGAIVEVRRNDRVIDVLRPRVNLFPGQQMTVPTPDVHYTWGYDLYLNVASTISPDQDFVVLRAVRSPLVTWIWIGGALLVLGTGYALTPSRRAVPSRSTVRAEKAGGTDGGERTVGA
jgi:cytochrome c-type biogenesis protein CcmF